MLPVLRSACSVTGASHLLFTGECAGLSVCSLDNPELNVMNCSSQVALLVCIVITTESALRNSYSNEATSHTCCSCSLAIDLCDTHILVCVSEHLNGLLDYHGRMRQHRIV